MHSTRSASSRVDSYAGVQHNDSEKTKEQIREAEALAKSSKETMQRVLSRAEETRKVAAGTLETLGQQGEQIRRIQASQDRIHTNTDTANRHIRSIESVGGQLQNALTSDTPTRYDSNAKLDKREKEMRLQAAHGKEDKKAKKVTLKGKKEELPEELGILSKEAQQDVRDTDRMLDTLQGSLSDLKLMALNMGAEVAVQNERLDALNRSSTDNRARLQATNARVKKAT